MSDGVRGIQNRVSIIAIHHQQRRLLPLTLAIATSFILLSFSPVRGADEFRIIEDATTGVRVALPLNILTHEKTIPLGRNWSSSDGHINIATLAFPSGQQLAAIQAKLSGIKGRVISRSDLRGESFIIEGHDRDGGSFYVAAYQRGNTIRGLAISFDGWRKAEYASLVERVVQSFEPFPLTGQEQSGSAKEIRSFCKDAQQHVASDSMLGEAIEAVFGRADDARYSEDGECISPLEVLHYTAVDVLITNVAPDGSCHVCRGHLSAYVLQRRQGNFRLIKSIIDFFTGGQWGSPGKLTPTRFVGDDTLILTSLGSGMGYSEEQLRLFVFRGGRIVELTGAQPIILSAANGGAVGESEALSVKGRWIIEPARDDKLIIDYKVTKRGAARRERVVWGLHDGHLWREEGQEPPELGVASGN